MTRALYALLMLAGAALVSGCPLSDPYFIEEAASGGAHAGAAGNPTGPTFGGRAGNGPGLTGGGSAQAGSAGDGVPVAPCEPASCQGLCCKAVCVDWTTDDKNCGACGVVCGARFSCVGGRCVPHG